LAAWLPPVSDGHQWSPSDYAIRNTIRSEDDSFPLRHHPPCGWQQRVTTTHYAIRNTIRTAYGSNGWLRPDGQLSASIGFKYIHLDHCSYSYRYQLQHSQQGNRDWVEKSATGETESNEDQVSSKS